MAKEGRRVLCADETACAKAFDDMTLEKGYWFSTEDSGIMYREESGDRASEGGM